jgi:hypothetical protein
VSDQSQSAMSSLRKPKVDPYATSDIAREHSLTATQAWCLHLLAIQAEYRSAEWPGTLTLLSDALRCGRKTAVKDVTALVDKGLVEIVEPFRGGAEGRVRVLVRDRIVIRRRPQNASDDAGHDQSDRARFASGSRRVRVGFVPDDANEQEEQGGSQVHRHRGSKGLTEDGGRGRPCRHCGKSCDGHEFGDHEPEPDSAEQLDHEAFFADAPFDDSPPRTDADFDRFDTTVADENRT